MVDTPKKDDDDAPVIDTGWVDFEQEFEESEVSERPTLAPPFDLESFAKAEEAGGGKPSDTAITAAPPADHKAPLPEIPKAPRAPTAPTSQPFSQRSTPQEGPRATLYVPPLAMPKTAPPMTPSMASRRPRSTLLAMANENASSTAPPPALPEDGPPPSSLKGGIGAPGSSGDPTVEMTERFALGDYSGALVVAESMLEENPAHGEALECAESCRSVLQQMYTARIGPLDRVPIVEVQRDQMRWLSLDHRAGFVLSLVDGVSSLEMILDVSGMATLDALRILYELVQQRIISFR